MIGEEEIIWLVSGTGCYIGRLW